MPPSDFTDIREQLSKIHQTIEQNRQDLLLAQERLKQIEAEETRLMRFFHQTNSQRIAHRQNLKGQRSRIQNAINDLQKSLTNNQKNLDDHLKKFKELSDSSTGIEELDASYPFLLFPLRIETRFKFDEGNKAKHQLWVRVYPDDCVIDTFENVLSTTEMQSAQHYWLEMWRAGGNEANERSAWRGLVASHGSGRALWLVAPNGGKYLPKNLAKKPKDRDETVLTLVIGTDTPLKDEKEQFAVEVFWRKVWLADGSIEAITTAQEELQNALGIARAQVIIKRYKPISLDPPLADDEQAIVLGFLQALWEAGDEAEAITVAQEELQNALGPALARAQVIIKRYKPISLDPPLADDEQAIVLGFLQTLWEAEDNAEAITVAQEELQNALGPALARAQVIIEQYRPYNLKDAPPTLVQSAVATYWKERRRADEKFQGIEAAKKILENAIGLERAQTIIEQYLTAIEDTSPSKKDSDTVIAFWQVVRQAGGNAQALASAQSDLENALEEAQAQIVIEQYQSLIQSEVLTDDEHTAVMDFLQAMWEAGDDTEAIAAAQEELQNGLGSSRAQIIIRQYQAFAWQEPLEANEHAAVMNFLQAVWQARDDAEAVAAARGDLQSTFEPARIQSIIRRYQPFALEDPLTDSEHAAVMEFLQAMWEAGDDAEAIAAAQEDLQTALGSTRAQVVIERYQSIALTEMLKDDEYAIVKGFLQVVREAGDGAEAIAAAQKDLQDALGTARAQVIIEQYQIFAMIEPLADALVDKLMVVLQDASMSFLQTGWWVGNIDNMIAAAESDLQDALGTARAQVIIEQYRVLTQVEPLTDDEHTAVMEFLRAVWKAGDDAEAVAAAQEDLQNVLGPARAQFIIERYQPFALEDPLTDDEFTAATDFLQAMWEAGDDTEAITIAQEELQNALGTARAQLIIEQYRVLTQVEPLTDDEHTAVMEFLRAVWKAGDDAEVVAAAQEELQNALGPARAQLIIEQYRHTSWTALLTDGEHTAVMDFLRAVWEADEDAIVAAREALQLAAGRRQALSVITHYESISSADLKNEPPAYVARDVTTVTVATVEFPKSNEIATKRNAWSQPARVDIMPERLRLLGYIGDEKVIDEPGEPIPSPLIVGPDPSAPPEQQMRREGDDIVVSDEMKWMVDFEEAYAKGMGFKASLDHPRYDPEKGLDKLLVLGVRLSSDHHDAQRRLETLFRHHHHSRDGLSLLKQGTATNNTDESGTEFSKVEDADDTFDIISQNEPLFTLTDDPFEKRDGQCLAEWLGVDPAMFQSVRQADGMDQIEARAMNIALWPATIGYFMDMMMAPVFSDEVIDYTWQFFINHVSGRGMVPAVRIGKQPYGILPTTVFSRVSGQFPSNFESASALPPAFLEKGHNVLTRAYAKWHDLVQKGKVSKVGKSSDPHQTLLDIIGLHASSVEQYKRYALNLDSVTDLSGIGVIANVIISALAYLAEGMVLLREHGYHNSTWPLILKKYFFNRPRCVQTALIDDRPLSETQEIRHYTTDGRNYLEWLADAARTSLDTVRKQEGFEGQLPASLLHLMLRRALLLGYYDAGKRLYQAAGLLSEVNEHRENLIPSFGQLVEEVENEQSLWNLLYQERPEITDNRENITVAEYIPLGLEHEPELNRLHQQIKALEILASAPTARLERAFTEHLDTCTYRLDSWMLGLANHRHATVRFSMKTSANNGTRQGLYLGAYGWLENVRPEKRNLIPVELEDDKLAAVFNGANSQPIMRDDTNAGFVHAPSLNHAVTAAVLRNAYLTNANADHPEMFAINLSSERVRRAMGVLEGIQSEQNLSAMLGYQFERGLHDRHDQVEVDEFIYELRKAFPLRPNRLPDSANDGPDEAKESIEARNVIDGLALINQINKTGIKEYPFGKSGLPKAKKFDEKQIDAVNDEVNRLFDLYDALADLAVAEGVHQVVQGNFERAAGILGASSKGSFPPIPDVAQTPRSGASLTHRVVLHFKSGWDFTLIAPLTDDEHAAVSKFLLAISEAGDDAGAIADAQEELQNSLGLARAQLIIEQYHALTLIAPLTDDEHAAVREFLRAMWKAWNDVAAIAVAQKDLENALGQARSRVIICQYQTIPNTPRAGAEPAINQWLADILPDPENVVCHVTFTNERNMEGDEVITQKDLNLQPIDLLFMLDLDDSQAMTVLDEYIIYYVLNKRSLPPDVVITIRYTERIDNSVSLFELAALIRSLRSLILEARPLTAVDMALPDEAGTHQDRVLTCSPARIRHICDALTTTASDGPLTLLRKLETELSDLDLTPGPSNPDVPLIVAGIDSRLEDFLSVLSRISLYGLPQTGYGFVIVWRRNCYTSLIDKVRILVERWENKREGFTDLLEKYNALPVGTDDQERFEILQRAEAQISTILTTPLPNTPADYMDIVNDKASEFDRRLSDFQSVMQTTQTALAELIREIEEKINESPPIAAIDREGLDLNEDKQKIVRFSRDILSHVIGLVSDLNTRVVSVNDDLATYASATKPSDSYQAFERAAQTLLGEDFRIVPEFTLAPEQADEIHNTYHGKDQLLRYLTNKMEIDFPVDDWLHGIARVQEKMHHWENITLLAGTFGKDEPELHPMQLPFNDSDYWLALEFKSSSQNADNGSNQAYQEQNSEKPKIDGARLLYTAYFPEDYTESGPQCGLVLDEWSELIPSQEETTGVTFHYDRPNSEAPQVLLLVTPPDSTEQWKWADLVDTLHETLEMAKCRAVEPDHIEHTRYARFLPATISAVTYYVNWVFRLPSVVFPFPSLRDMFGKIKTAFLGPSDSSEPS
jgi:sulfur relay (sulfurtransferase) DsrC/TusE family protein